MKMVRFRGFSIVELVAVIAIVSLLAALAIPRFFEIGDYQDRTFYDQAVGSVRYAQKLAMATRCTVRVEFTATGLALYIPASPSGCATGPYNTPVFNPANAAPYTLTAPSGMTLTAANFSFVADGGTATTVTINVGSRSFRVNATTGFVQEL